MTPRRFFLAVVAALLVYGITPAAEAPKRADTASGEWKQLPSVPDREGFAGPFAGVSNGALLVAGGANFPDKKPWDGGKKVWYDSVFVLEKPDGKWKAAGKLPRPLAYGISVTHGNGVVCVGGGDGERHYADVFRLDWKEGKLVTTKLPSLPKPLANAAGALVGDTLCVAGGQEKPDARDTLKRAWKIDLAAAEPKWQEIGAWPGSARMLSVAASFEGAFWLIGGTDLVVGKDDKAVRRYLKDAYRYDPDKGWKQIADFPYPVVAAPSPAPTDATGFFIFGGDDGTQVNVAHDLHRGFSKKVVHYDVKTDKWVESGELAKSPATVPCVLWNKLWVVPNGEVRPGIRTPEVWGWMQGRE